MKQRNSYLVYTMSKDKPVNNVYIKNAYGNIQLGPNFLKLSFRC